MVQIAKSAAPLIARESWARVEGSRCHMSLWMKKFLSWTGCPWPRDYVTFDMETTGLKVDFDLPVDIGWCRVIDGEAVSQGSVVLDWTQHPDVADPRWLHGELSRIDSIMRERGSSWIYSPNYLHTTGIDPFSALKKIKDILVESTDEGAVVVGHNALAFDCRMLSGLWDEFDAECGEPFKFSDNGVYDTGAMEKAIQAEILPTEYDNSLSEFFSRVQRMRLPGIKWSLATCVERYGLDQKYGVDTSQAHQAGYDAYLCHILMEEIYQCQQSM